MTLLKSLFSPKKILAAAAAGAVSYLDAKIGHGPTAMIVMGVTYLASHYFHYQPSPASTEDSGNP